MKKLIIILGIALTICYEASAQTTAPGIFLWFLYILHIIKLLIFLALSTPDSVERKHGVADEIIACFFRISNVQAS